MWGRLVKKAKTPCPEPWERADPRIKRAPMGAQSPSVKDGRGPGGRREPVGAWSAELRAGGMDVGVALGQGGTQLASSPE